MNKLSKETSPYLLQHAENPVHWHAWKPETLAKAKELDKPILVSIGYSTCHWCHVMERESFEDEATAELMNEYFINIKVDREERPDVDQIYMEACQIVSGNGGWPLNCFLTPDGRPFFAGTYYPPLPAHGRPSWKQVLTNLHSAFLNQRETVEEQANKLTEIIQNSDGKLLGNQIEGLTKEQVFTPVILSNLYYNLHQRFDQLDGGFGGAPKFPSSMTIQFLLNYHHFTGHLEALEQAELSLQKMIRGGIYDQIGGGFARYTVDSKWLVPHFEKMLYDNALLVSVIAEAYKKTRKEVYKETIEETLNWVEREMTNKQGGFYSALDADSEGVEGKFYVWSEAEILEELGDFGKTFNQFYDVSVDGNWEEVNILNRKQSYAEFAAQNNISDLVDFKQKIKTASQKLLKKRAERIRPGLDDKSLLDWNALQISAYAKAYEALQKEEYREKAKTGMHFVFEHFKNGEGLTLFHTWKDGQAQYDAFLNDYAFLIEALIDVYEITFEESYLMLARDYTDFVLQDFLDKEAKLFYFTSANQEQLVARRKDIYDSALPSGNSTMVRNLQRLSIMVGRSDYKDLAVEMLMTVRDAVEKYPLSFGRWAGAIQNEVHGIKEIAVVGAEAHQKAKSIQKDFLPNKVLMVTTVTNDKFPLLAGKSPKNDTYIYICENFACQKPVLKWNSNDE